jgi:hypothetical protein
MESWWRKSPDLSARPPAFDGKLVVYKKPHGKIHAASLFNRLNRLINYREMSALHMRQ